jgi:PPOX class probable F420-dependent enzyme
MLVGGARMTVLNDAARRFLRGGPLAHVVTLDPDGRAQVTLAWVDLQDDDRLAFATLFDQHKLRNLRRDPRVTCSFEGEHTNPIGLREYLVVHGRAEVTEGGAPELLSRLAQVYIGPGTEFPPMPDPPPGFVTYITVERVRGVGEWAGG